MKAFSLNIKERVANLLSKNMRSRDDDGYLIARIWYDDLVNQGCSKEVARRICETIANTKLTSSESIRRCRQKLQEDEPDKYGRSERRQQKAMETKIAIAS